MENPLFFTHSEGNDRGLAEEMKPATGWHWSSATHKPDGSRWGSEGIAAIQGSYGCCREDKEAADHLGWMPKPNSPFFPGRELGMKWEPGIKGAARMCLLRHKGKWGLERLNRILSTWLSCEVGWPGLLSEQYLLPFMLSLWYQRRGGGLRNRRIDASQGDEFRDGQWRNLDRTNCRIIEDLCRQPFGMYKESAV